MNASEAFDLLIKTMERDNGSSFVVSNLHRSIGSSAVALMQASGMKFQIEDAHDLDGIFWEIAAGEQSETEAKYGDVPGYLALSLVLNKIFER